MNIIKLPEKFDYGFRDEIYKYLGKKDIIVDFKRTTYIDSTALGLMLMLREKKKGKNKIKLINIHYRVKAIIDMANFQMLFDIEDNK